MLEINLLDAKEKKKNNMAFNTNSNSAAKNAEKEENVYGLGWNDEISNDGGLSYFQKASIPLRY